MSNTIEYTTKNGRYYQIVTRPNRLQEIKTISYMQYNDGKAEQARLKIEHEGNRRWYADLW